MCEDAIRPILFMDAGEIRLGAVALFHSEPASGTHFGRARKCLVTQALAFRTHEGRQSVFVTCKGRVRGWEDSLSEAGVRPATR